MSSIPSDVLLKFMAMAAVAFFFLATAFLSSALKIVPEYKRIVLFRAGRSLGTRGPGIVTVIPFLDLAVWVDLQPTFRFRCSDLPVFGHRKLSCHVTLEGRISDPEKSVLNVPNLETALYKVVETALIDSTRGWEGGELALLQGRLEEYLQEALSRAGRAWGFDPVKVTITDLQQV